MDDKNEKQRVPKLRLPGFTDEWEQRKLGDILASLQNNTLSRAELSNQGTAKNVHYGDILVKYGEVLDVRKEQLPRIADETIAAKYKTSFLQNGDIIVTDTAEDETVGKCSEIVGLEDDIVIAGLHTIPYRPQVHFGAGYLGYYMNSDAYHRQLLPLMQGIKVTSISKSAMQDTYMVFPKSEDEQSKIGNYFCCLDYLISLHLCKIEDLQNQKKGLLQKMFPRDGKRVPEIRFPGYKDEWKQRKLGELGTLKNGMNFSKEAMGIGFPFVNLQNIFGKTIIDYQNLGKAEANEKQLKDYNLVKGDILFVRYSVKLEGVGEAALVPITLKDTTYSGFIIRFRDEYGMDSNFKRFMFSTREVRNQIISEATDSANKNISQTVLASLELFIPVIEEQQQIGALFEKIDRRIALHQRKLDHLKELKKGLLQQMFV